MIALYHSPRTRSVRVLWLLEELGLPYELHTLAFSPDSLKGADYLKINPLGKVPTITDGALTMFESGAIVEYLLERYGDGRLAPKVGTPARAEAVYRSLIAMAKSVEEAAPAPDTAASLADLRGAIGRVDAQLLRELDRAPHGSVEQWQVVLEQNLSLPGIDATALSQLAAALAS